MRRLSELLLVVGVVVIFIFGIVSATKASQDPGQLETVHIPVTCGSTAGFVVVMKELNYSMPMYKAEADGIFFAVFIKDKSVIITNSYNNVTCILTKHDDVDLDFKKLLPEM